MVDGRNGAFTFCEARKTRKPNRLNRFGFFHALRIAQNASESIVPAVRLLCRGINRSRTAAAWWLQIATGSAGQVCRVAAICDFVCMSDLSDQIQTDATKSASSSTDGVSISRRSLSELIAADQYIRSIDAVNNPAKNLRNMVSQIVPPGGTGVE